MMHAYVKCPQSPCSGLYKVRPGGSSEVLEVTQSSSLQGTSSLAHTASLDTPCSLPSAQQVRSAACSLSSAKLCVARRGVCPTSQDVAGRSVAIYLYSAAAACLGCWLRRAMCVCTCQAPSNNSAAHARWGCLARNAVVQAWSSKLPSRQL